MAQVLIRVVSFDPVSTRSVQRRKTFIDQLVPDYVDKDYEHLAVKAQAIIKNDPDLKPYYFENGFTFCIDGKPGALNTLWNNMLHNLKTEHSESAHDQCDTPDDIYRHLHGMDAKSVPSATFPSTRKWIKGFTSKRCATVNAEAIIKVYYKRCALQPNIDFQIGMPVNYLLYNEDKSSVEGVVLENGRKIIAGKVIVSAGPWSSRLVKLDHEMHANAVPIVYFKLTPEEYEQYKDIACHTNITTGMNIYTPLGGLLKVLRRETALRNTTILKDPEDPTKFYKASYPLTKLDDPFQTLPFAMEQSIRDELREIFPAVADRPFFNTKFCWYVH
jgi:glycine/D-amino acid oxidase-like deaminating enzyme